MNEALDLFNELFYSTEIWGFTGVIGLVLFGYWLTKQDKNLGLGYFVIILIMSLSYLPLITTYYWHLGILLLGGMLVCLVPQLSR